MSLRHWMGVTALLAAVSIAGAAVVEVDEFTGEAFEGFEAIGPQGGYPSPLEVLGGAATIDDSLAHTIMIAVSLFSAPTGEYIYPYNGNLMGGSPTGWGVIEFAEPVTDFGGYVGTADELTGTTVTFLDEQGATIDSLPMVVQHPLWAWHGWHSDTPIKQIQFKADTNPGKPLVFDDLRLIVPEPATFAAFVVGAALLLRRGR